MISSHAAMPISRGGFPAHPGMFAFGHEPPDVFRTEPPQLPVDELELRHLRTAEDFNAVRELRAHIDTSHLALDPRFREHEKKEMSWAWQSHSRCEASSSEPSGRFRCATA